MRKLIGLLFILLISVSIAWAQRLVVTVYNPPSEEELMVGQQLRTEYDFRLTEEVRLIERKLVDMADDGYITKRDMLCFERMVKDFDKKQTRYDMHLRRSGLTTTPELPLSYRRIISTYFTLNEGKIRYGDDELGTVRRTVAELTGNPVLITEGYIKSAISNIAWFVFALTLSVFIRKGFGKSNVHVGNGLSVFTFVIMLGFYILVV